MHLLQVRSRGVTYPFTQHVLMHIEVTGSLPQFFYVAQSMRLLVLFGSFRFTVDTYIFT